MAFKTIKGNKNTRIATASRLLKIWDYSGKIVYFAKKRNIVTRFLVKKRPCCYYDG